MRAVEIARRLEISRASVYRILDDARRSMVTTHGPRSPCSQCQILRFERLAHEPPKDEKRAVAPPRLTTDS